MQDTKLKIKGLYTYPNALSEVPEGALKEADNIVIPSESVAEPRRGFGELTYGFSDSAYRGVKFGAYQSKILVNYNTSTLAYYDVSTGWVNYTGSFTSPDADLAIIKFLESASNLYITTNTGVKRLDAYNGTPVSAGVPRALDIQTTLTGASGFMATNKQIAYRHVWGVRDANNKLLLGAPSARSVIANATGGTRDVSLVITIPAGITTAYFVQVYRSGPSATSTSEPNDELQLVYEANPTALEITAGVMNAVTDLTPDSLRGANLYTNANDEGILQSNNPPPYTKDFAVFQGSVFYANITFKHRKNITLLSVGGANGIAATDTVNIGGVGYLGHATIEDHTATPPTFLVVTGGTAAQNIADTATSLCRVINKRSNSTVYALYLSGYNDLPGQILLEERSFGGVSFAVTASAHGSAWNPVLPTSGTSVSSAAETHKNGLAVAKTDEPDAVPESNELFAGSAGDPILRVLALRDSLFALKESEGIYRISGSDPTDFGPELFDSTTRLLAPESAVVLNNQIWCLSDQGVVAISDTGVDVKSLPIEDTLLELFGTARDTVKRLSFAVASETDRRYILFLPSSATDTYCTQAFAYSTATQTWTRWPISAVSGFVNPEDDKIYLVPPTSHKMRQERKTFTALDFMDEEYAVTITSFSGTSIVLNSVVDVEVGDLLYQSSAVKSVVLAVDALTLTVTVADDLSTWTVAAASVFRSYECVIEWLPLFGGDPGMQKHYSEAQLFFSQNRFSVGSFGFSSDLSASVEETEFNGVGLSLWGLFPWGSGTWGAKRFPRPFRTYVPREKQRCTQLSVRFTIKEAQGSFRLTGMSVRSNQMSTETTR